MMMREYLDALTIRIILCTMQSLSICATVRAWIMKHARFAWFFMKCTAVLNIIHYTIYSGALRAFHYVMRYIFGVMLHAVHSGPSKRRWFTYMLEHCASI